ncbi:MAG: DegT/DnrJ/EryC1/StrS family aminotransferase [Patescibacteria group bacterium]
MKAIFNSLGSDYDKYKCNLSLLQLFKSDKKNLDKLKEYFVKKYNAKVYFFYKGRDAIEFVLKKYNIGKGDIVATQAFSCYAIEQGVKRSGAGIIYVDLSEDSICPSLEDFKNTYKQAKNIKAIILQYTFGFSKDVRKIAEWCKENNILLIEDLAQSYGSVSSNEKKLGNYADALVFSFGKGKIIDALSGGTAVLKGKNFSRLEDKLNLQKIPKIAIFKDLLYPSITSTIRKTYKIGIGKIIFIFAKWMGVIYSSVAEKYLASEFPYQYASLVLYSISELNKDIKHRRIISNNYLKITNGKILITASDIERSTCLRFPILFKNSTKVIEYLKKNNIHIFDRWYKNPVDCGSVNCNSDYKLGSCPNAEYVSKNIINLPTHREINIDVSNKIIYLLNIYNE